jgi:hypothetical protein
MRWATIWIALVVFGCGAEADPPEPYVVASGQGRAFALAVNDDALFWSGDTGVRRMSLPDGDVRWIGDGTPSLAMAVDDERVYWAETDRVVWAPVEGGTPRLIATDQRCVFAMATDGRRLFWASIIDGSVWSWDSETGVILDIAVSQNNPTSLAVHDDHVFWTTGDGRVTSMRTDGSRPRFLADDQPWLSSVAVDGERVYFASGTGSIRSVSRTGGSVDRVADGMPLATFAGGIAADDDDVYWITAMPDDSLGGEVRYLEHGEPGADVVGRTRATTVALDRDTIYWTTADGDVVARKKGHSDAY